jgi:hypothetical protein
VRAEPVTECSSVDTLANAKSVFEKPGPGSWPSEYDIVAGDGLAFAPAAEPGCSITDQGVCIANAINSWLRGVIIDALDPSLELPSGTLLTTPTLAQMPWGRTAVSVVCRAPRRGA